jgi:cell division protein FtsA
MDFVTYHLKQVGLDNKMLNGGVILTGGGSQLRHLIQLTEYVTGLNARIGYPNEHLASGHVDELANPMYSTCIGLILKGQNIYENSPNRLVPQKDDIVIIEDVVTPPVLVDVETTPSVDTPVVVGGRVRSLKEFIQNIKTGIIGMFEETEDKKFQ